MGGIIGVDTFSLSPWKDNVYVLAVDEKGRVTETGPFEAVGGECNLTPDGRNLMCVNWERGEVTVIEVATGSITATREIGHSDSIDPHGILADWGSSLPNLGV
jgi:hypothetical protein